MYKLVSFVILLACIGQVDASSGQRTTASLASEALELVAAATDTTIPDVNLDDYALERVVRRHTLQQFGGDSDLGQVARFLGIGVGLGVVVGRDFPKYIKNVLMQYKEGNQWHTVEQKRPLFSGVIFQALDDFAGVKLAQKDADVLLKRVIAQHIVDVCAEDEYTKKCREILRGTTLLPPHQLRIYQFIVDKESKAAEQWVQNLYKDTEVPDGLKMAWTKLNDILIVIEQKLSTYDLPTLQKKLVDLEVAKRRFCRQSQDVFARLKNDGILPSDRLASSGLAAVSRGVDARLGIEWRYEEAAEGLAAAWGNKLLADAAHSDSASAVAAPAVSAEGPAGAGSGAGGAGSGVVNPALVASVTAGASAPGVPTQPVNSAWFLANKPKLSSALNSLYHFTAMIGAGSVAHQLHEVRKDCLRASSDDELRKCFESLDGVLANFEIKTLVKNSMHSWMNNHQGWKVPGTWKGVAYIEDIFNQVQSEWRAARAQTGTSPRYGKVVTMPLLPPLPTPFNDMKAQLLTLLGSRTDWSAMITEKLSQLEVDVQAAPSVDRLRQYSVILDSRLVDSEVNEWVRNNMRTLIEGNPERKMPVEWRDLINLKNIFNQVQSEWRAARAQASIPISAIAPPAQLPPAVPQTVVEDAGFISDAFAGGTTVLVLPSQPLSLPMRSPAVAAPDRTPGPPIRGVIGIPAELLADEFSPESAQNFWAAQEEQDSFEEQSVPPVSSPAVSPTQPDGGSRPVDSSTQREPVKPQPQKHDTTLARGVQYAGGVLTAGVLGYLLAQMLKDRDSRAVVARAFQKLAGKKVAPLTSRQQRAAKRLQRDGGIAGVGTVLGIAALLGGSSLRKQKRVA